MPADLRLLPRRHAVLRGGEVPPAPPGLAQRHCVGGAGEGRGRRQGQGGGGAGREDARQDEQGGRGEDWRRGGGEKGAHHSQQGGKEHGAAKECREVACTDDESPTGDKDKEEGKLLGNPPQELCPGR